MFQPKADHSAFVGLLEIIQVYLPFVCIFLVTKLRGYRRELSQPAAQLVMYERKSAEPKINVTILKEASSTPWLSKDHFQPVGKTRPKPSFNVLATSRGTAIEHPQRLYIL